MREVQPKSEFFFGAAYYPDYLRKIQTIRLASGQIVEATDLETMKDDFLKMQKYGIKIIRMGEFSWAKVESAEGVFTPEIFINALDLAASFDIQVMMCTPTATPPKWLIDKCPSILPQTRTGDTIPFGSRRHYDFCHPYYKDQSKRIVSYFAKTFGTHPAVSSWQIDNEFGCHNSVFLFSDHIKIAFQNYLRKKYENDIEKCCEELFLDFWSQRVTSFHQLELPKASWADQSPGLELEFRLFCQTAIQEFQDDQIRIIKKENPKVPVTHNFMTSFFDLDPWRVSENLDFIGFDHYQMAQDPSPVRSSWQFGLMYSLKNKPFLVLEQQPVQVNWQKINRRFSFDWLFLWGFQSLFCGSSGMLYFSWRKFYGGAEQFHDAILPHDVRLSISSTAQTLQTNSVAMHLCQEFFELEDRLTPLHQVVCLFDFSSKWAADICSQSEIYRSEDWVDLCAQYCLQRGLGMKIVSTLANKEFDWENVSLILVPSHLWEWSTEESAVLKKYLNSGGHVVTLPRTASKLRNSQMSPFPGTLYDRNDFLFEDAGALLPNELERIKVKSGQILNGIVWAEKIHLQSKSWSVEARFIGGLYDGYPAAIHREFLQGGSWLHLAFMPQDGKSCFDFWDRLLKIPVCLLTRHADVHIYPLTSGGRHFFGLINFSNEQCLVELAKGTKLSKYCFTKRNDVGPLSFGTNGRNKGATLWISGQEVLVVETASGDFKVESNIKFKMRSKSNAKSNAKSKLNEKETKNIKVSTKRVKPKPSRAKKK